MPQSLATVEFSAVPDARRSASEAIREIWAYREVVAAFASRATRVKYKQAALGAAWAILQPLAFLALFALFFGRVAHLGGGGVPYAAFALSALVPWQFASNGVSWAANALVTESNLVRKVYFPREAPVVGAIASTLVELAIGIALYLVVAPVLGSHLGLGLIYAPLLVALIVVPVVAISLPLAALNVYYRDFRYVLPVATQLWLFASPVAYPLTRIPHQWRALYALVNPVVGPLDGFRRALALNTAPDWGIVALSLLSSVILLLGGWYVFRRLELEFADVI